MRLWGERTRWASLLMAVTLLGTARAGAATELRAQALDSLPPRPASVLFIDDYDLHRPVWQATYRALVDEVTRIRGPNVELLPEGLDVTRSPDADHVEETMRWLVAKYRGRVIDVVLAHGAVSLETAIRLRTALGTELPIVYLRADPGRPATLTAIPDVPAMSAMVLGSVEAATASLMNRALPDLREVVLVVSSSQEARVLEGVFLDALPEGIEVTALVSPGIERTVEATRGKPAGTVALYYTTVNMDETGRVWRPQEHLRVLVPALDVPVFVSFTTQLVGGVLGGLVNDPTRLGTLLGSRLAEILDGRSIDTIPHESIPGWTLMFDWEAARRFGIRERTLGDPVTWMGQPVPVWVRYPKTVAGVSTLILGLFILSGFLTHSRSSLRVARNEKQYLSRRLIDVMEEERARIARDLHDDVCQDMTVLLLQMHHREAGTDASGAPRASEQLRDILGRTRAVARELYPAPVGLMSLPAAILALTDNLTFPTGIRFTVSEEDWPEDIPPPVALALYRSVQEALQNVIRHAQASECSVHLARDGSGVAIAVRDDGVGFDATLQGRPMQGIGILSMTERMESFGGKAEIHSSVVLGTEVRLRVPVLAMAGTL